jgi:hypothetical protein
VLPREHALRIAQSVRAPRSSERFPPAGMVFPKARQRIGLPSSEFIEQFSGLFPVLLEIGSNG